MLLIILIILIAVCVGSAVLVENQCRSDVVENTCAIVTVLTAIAAAVVLLCVLFNTITVIKGISLDDKIEVYSAQNSEIEKTVEETVKSFQSYEKDIIEEAKEMSPTMLLTIYPELKSNELIKEQIKVYVKNNDAIKKLEVRKVDVSLAKYLLYFGK